MFFKTIDTKKAAAFLPGVEQPFLNRKNQNTWTDNGTCDSTCGSTCGFTCNGTYSCNRTCDAIACANLDTEEKIECSFIP